MAGTCSWHWKVVLYFPSVCNPSPEGPWLAVCMPPWLCGCHWQGGVLLSNVCDPSHHDSVRLPQQTFIPCGQWSHRTTPSTPLPLNVLKTGKTLLLWGELLVDTRFQSPCCSSSCADHRCGAGSYLKGDKCLKCRRRYAEATPHGTATAEHGPAHDL